MLAWELPAIAAQRGARSTPPLGFRARKVPIGYLRKRLRADFPEVGLATLLHLYHRNCDECRCYAPVPVWGALTLRIGIDATCWANGRGYGRFTRELVGAMVRQAPADEFVCFVDARAQAAFALRSPNLRTVLVRQRVSPTEAAAAGSSRSPADMLRLTMAVAGERPDVFYCPSVYSYFPLAPGQRAVITIHDAIVERFPQLTVPGRTARLFWTAKVRLALAQARLVLTVSDYAADEVAEMLRVPRSRLRGGRGSPRRQLPPTFG